jgi:hypothetical protein
MIFLIGSAPDEVGQLFSKLFFINVLYASQKQGCQIFLDTINRNGEKYTKFHKITKWPKIYQMAIIY